MKHFLLALLLFLLPGSLFADEQYWYQLTPSNTAMIYDTTGFWKFDDIRPLADSTHDLGTAAVRWQAIYADDVDATTGTIATFDATSITVNDDILQQGSNPTLALNDNDGTIGYLRLASSEGVNYIQSGLAAVSDSAAPLVFGSVFNTTEWARFDNAGRFGIGTASPRSAYKLDVTGGIITSANVYAEGLYFVFGDTSGDGEYIYATGNDIDIVAGGSSRLQVDGDGGETIIDSATVSDLTATRLVLAGTSGALEDAAGLTWDGTDLTAGSAIVSDLTDNRVVIAGTSGALEDSASLTFDGTDLTAGSAVISDLTNNRVVTAGVGGALEDSSDLSFDGTTFQVTGDGYFVGKVGFSRQDVTLTSVTTFATTRNFVVLAGTSSETLTTITGGTSGQLITVLFADAQVTVTDTDAGTADTIDLAGTATNLTSGQFNTLQIVYSGTKWYEVSRSTN